jgi:hypothetical protein
MKTRGVRAIGPPSIFLSVYRPCMAIAMTTYASESHQPMRWLGSDSGVKFLAEPLNHFGRPSRA